MSLHLNQDELVERTGYKQHAKQCEELARQGIKFTVRHDGFPLVLRSQFELPLTVKGKRKEPDYGALTRTG